MSRSPGVPRPGGEDALVAWLRKQPGTDRIGDDAAVLPSGQFAVTTDTQVAGVHVPLDLDPAVIARRLLAVNLSDLAAMGAKPEFAFLIIAAPSGFDHRRFLSAFTQAAQEAEVELAGGDLSSSPTLLTALTLLGSPPTSGRVLRRDGASPGHRIWLGGSIGESHAGLELLSRGARMTGRSVQLPENGSIPKRLARTARRAVRRHLLPTAQLELGQWLAQETPEGAAIDLSDGLVRDLSRLASASKVGALVERAQLPLAPDAGELAACLAIDASDAACHGGEDYVLCFTLPPQLEPPSRFGCRAIGVIRQASGIFMRAADGVETRTHARGWDHLDGDRGQMSRAR